MAFLMSTFARRAANRQALRRRGTVVAATVDEEILCVSLIFNFQFSHFNFFRPSGGNLRLVIVWDFVFPLAFKIENVPIFYFAPPVRVMPGQVFEYIFVG